MSETLRPEIVTVHGFTAICYNIYLFCIAFFSFRFHDYIGVEEEVAFRTRNMRAPARGLESVQLLKLLKLPLTAFRGRELGEFH